MAKFRDVLEIRNGRNQRAVEATDGQYPIYGSGGIMGYANDYLCPAETTVLGRKGTINKPFFVEKPFWNVDTAFGLVANHQKLLPKYLYYFCCNHDFLQYSTTVTIPSLTKANLLDIDIHLPSIAEQHATVLTLDNVAALVGLQKLQLKKLDLLVKSRFVEMFGDPETNPMALPEKKLSEVLDVVGGYAFKSEHFSDEGVPVLRIGNINAGIFQPVNMVYWCEDEKLERYKMYPGDLVMSLTGTVDKDDYGNVCILSDDYDLYYLNQRNAKLEIRENLEKLYLSELLKFSAIKKRLTGISRGVRQANISNKDILNLVVSIPDMEQQRDFSFFVSRVDKSKLVVQKALDEAQKLFDSLMQQYFG